MTLGDPLTSVSQLSSTDAWGPPRARGPPRFPHPSVPVPLGPCTPLSPPPSVPVSLSPHPPRSLSPATPTVLHQRQRVGLWSKAGGVG